MSIPTAQSRYLPTETFWQTIAAEKLDERVEFSAWTGEEDMTSQCDGMGASRPDCQADADTRVEWKSEM